MPAQRPQSKRLHRLDRLPALIAALAWVLPLGAAGCDDDAGGPAAGRSRVIAVEAEEASDDDVEAFCDSRAAAGKGARVKLPKVDGETPSLEGRWHWINVWATWCKPCVEEMPMLTEWTKRLASDDAAVDMIFISVDESAEEIEAFRKKHPEIPASLRMADKDALGEWLEQLGMEPGATIPVQVFADPKARVRCIRSGAVSESDYPTVRRLLSAG